MDKLTPEAVAKHAEAWPNWAGAPGALWRVTKSGVLPRFVILGVRVGAMPVEDLRPGEKGTIWVWDPLLSGPWRILGDDDYAGWSITPVRPDGSDLPGTEYERGVIDARSAVIEGLRERQSRHGPSDSDLYLGVAADDMENNAVWMPAASVSRAAANPAMDVGEAYDRGRAEGRAEERAAIVKGLEGVLEEAWKRHGSAMQDEESAYIGMEIDGYDVVMAALKAGEWSAKP